MVYFHTVVYISLYDSGAKPALGVVVVSQTTCLMPMPFTAHRLSGVEAWDTTHHMEYMKNLPASPRVRASRSEDVSPAAPASPPSPRWLLIYRNSAVRPGEKASGTY